MSRKDEIIKIAYKEFLAHGYHKTSMSSIAKKLGISKPALYYHFESKKDLYLDVVNTFNKKVHEQTGTIDHSLPTAKLRLKNLFTNFLKMSYSDIFGDKDISNLSHYYFTIDAMNSFPELRETILSNGGVIVDLMNQVINEGVLHQEIKEDLDKMAVLFHIGIMIEGFSAVSLFLEEIDEDIFNRYFEMFWEMIARK